MNHDSCAGDGDFLCKDNCIEHWIIDKHEYNKNKNNNDEGMLQDYVGIFLCFCNKIIMIEGILFTI